MNRQLGVLCGTWLCFNKQGSLGDLGLVMMGSCDDCGALVGPRGEAHSKELDRWLSQLALGISAEAPLPQEPTPLQVVPSLKPIDLCKSLGPQG